MGWASGAALAGDVWQMVRAYIPTRSRKRLAKKVVDLFESYDCDTMDEAEQLMKDAGLEDRWSDE